MINALHYISGISPDIGGIEQFVLNIYSQKDDDVEFEILTRHMNCDTELYKMLKRSNITIHNLDIEHLNLHTIGEYRKKLNEFFSLNAHKYDVLHCHSFTDPCICKAAKKNGIKNVLLHIHSYIPKGKIIKTAVKKLTLYSNCKNANQYLACSLDVGKATYSQKYADKIKVINNGINFDKYKFDENIRKEVRKTYELENQFTVIHIGRFCEEKNHEFLIKIFNKIKQKNPNSKLILAGDGEYREKIEKLCRDLNIYNDVLFLGNRSDVNNLLKAADVFIFPSKSEGFGMAVIEAQASGLPTFVSADVIPNTVKISDLVQFIKLDDNEEKWAEIILNYKNDFPREKLFDILCQSEFNAKNTYLNLKKLYKTNMGEKYD